MATATKPKPTAVAKRDGTAIVSYKEAVQKELADLANRTGAPGGDLISIGQDKTFRLPDGTKHPGPLQMVIVDFITGRFFYDRPFDSKNPSPPACFAISSNPTDMAPTKDVPNRQSDACSGCPLNEFGSAGDGKACKEMRLLAVIPKDADAQTEVSVLKVSPTALKAFDSYVKSIASSLGMASFQVVTEVSFDSKLDYASLRFGNPEPADEDLAQLAFSLREKARARLMSPPDTSKYEAPPKTKRR